MQGLLASVSAAAFISYFVIILLCLEHFLGINPCAVVCSSKLRTGQWWYFTKTWLPHLSALPALLCSNFLVYECVYSLAPTSRELHFS